ncbi:MAG: hypothetical protein JWP36_1613 [Paucimonas sp.]|nr:hypothetical protein [Paucimonas sp.]
MRIFISSLIGGFEPFRAAARSAIAALRHEPVAAEDFGSQASSPQIACLQGVRSADLVVLILGPRYGVVQGSSGVSPTHEEYLEARGKKPILMFVQEGVERDEPQAKFVLEVGDWQAGHFRAGFKTADELRDLVTRAVHDYQLANAAGPLDTRALSTAALALLSKARQNSRAASPTLHVGLVGGPIQQLLRPAELEAPDLADAIHQRALFVEPKLFSRSKGVDPSIMGSALVVEQERGARIQLSEDGSLLLRLPLSRTEGSRQNGFGMLAVIQEDVLRELAAALSFCAWLLDKIDSTQRITHVALVASIEASDYMGWRTQAEQDASPNSGTMRMAGGQQPPISSTDRPRAALRFQAAELAQDLMVPLRRQMKG